jgi:hypothetical protein
MRRVLKYTAFTAGTLLILGVGTFVTPILVVIIPRSLGFEE